MPKFKKTKSGDEVYVMLMTIPRELYEAAYDCFKDEYSCMNLQQWIRNVMWQAILKRRKASRGY